MSDSELYSSTKAFVAVHKSQNRPGNLMYVLLDDRAAFDLIDLPEGGNREVRNKAIDHGGHYVIFQYWLNRTDCAQAEVLQTQIAYAVETLVGDVIGTEVRF